MSEVVALKVSDIDSQRMTLRVEQGKGRPVRGVAIRSREKLHNLAALAERSVDEGRPSLHHLAPPLQRVAPPIGRLGLRDQGQDRLKFATRLLPFARGTPHSDI